jgi:hypothetical protein
MEPVGNEAVEGARFHGHTVHACEGLVCNVEGLQHPKALMDRKQQQRISHHYAQESFRQYCALFSG